jgi:DNA-binding CsgD family transcriptional regulator
VNKIQATAELIRHGRALAEMVIAGQRQAAESSALAYRNLHDALTEWRRPVKALPATDNPRLTPRERQVVNLIASGKSAKQAARELGIGAGTIKIHLKSARAKNG